MGLPPGMLLPGLLLLLGQGAAPASPEEDTTENEPWPTLVVLKSLPFPCNPKKVASKETSTSVHSLRPSDIKIVASIGNVENFQNSAEVSDVEKTKRTGKKVCLGIVTDIIRHFNPHVLKPMCTPGKELAPRGGAEGLSTQAVELVRSMKLNQQLDFQNDWKLINVFFSNASHCHLCLYPQQQKFVKNALRSLSDTLDYLHREVPKVYVNLIDLSMALESSSLLKDTVASQEVQTCKCEAQSAIMFVSVSQWFYQETWESILFSSKYNQGESFTLTYQPFFNMKNVSSLLKEPLLWNPNALALHLWNSMMEPAGHKEKPFGVMEGTLISCPPQGSPYFYTFRNSNYQPSSQLPVTVLRNVQKLRIRCTLNKPSVPSPKSVHKLLPADIKVIAAMGESATAATAAVTTSDNDINDYRGVSWSIGGDETLLTTVTLPNVFREFNSNLTGYSTGVGDKNNARSRLNRAVANAESGDMVNQATELINMMQKDSNINFVLDWKLLTLFIGTNDLCRYCQDKQKYSPENFLNNIKSALNLLKEKVPRMLVNLVSPMNIVPLKNLYTDRNLHCRDSNLRRLCPCLHSAAPGSSDMDALSETATSYQKLIRDLMETREYESEEFAVALDPFLENFPVPKKPLEPIHKRTTEYNITEEIELQCPQQINPYLKTYGNSIEIYGTPLRCKDSPPSSSKPTSVDSVRPADINIVAALGDSLTAGVGIDTSPGNVTGMETQFRGLSFSGGGDHTLLNVTTVPNIIKEFNAEVLGFAVGIGEASSGNSFLNRATPGAQAKDFLTQARSMVQKMKSDNRINLNDHWKVITVMFGNGDLCGFCSNPQEYTEEKFRENVRAALDYLKKEVPRAIVNLVDFMNPDITRQEFLDNPKCPTSKASTLCNCILTPKRDSPELDAAEKLAHSYQKVLRELVYLGEYDTKEDFTVLLHPFFETVIIPLGPDGTRDSSYFAADCIHLHQKFHTQFARALWDNMMTPLEKKELFWDLAKEVHLTCPSEDKPFLRTMKNSNYTYPGLPFEKKRGSEFLCTVKEPSTPAPSTAHRLRPADIKVVASLGDWMTTATGVSPSNVTNYLRSWRGLSWSIGGSKGLETHTTLPNILKGFNAEIHGASHGTWRDLSGLNVAKEGARALNLEGQVNDLEKLMKSKSEINFNEDWKLVTIFIGINDLCDYCDFEDGDAEDEYFQGVKKALDALKAKFPRTFVNLVQIMDFTHLYQNQTGSCKEPTKSLIGCPCFKFFSDPHKLEKLAKANKDFQSINRRLSSLKEYHDKEDFTVVLQPFLEKLTIPRNEEGSTEDRYFTEDCYHLTALTHDQMAVKLWNNMLEPVGSKSTYSDFTVIKNTLKCPTAENPYLPTGTSLSETTTTTPVTTIEITTTTVTAGTSTIPGTEATSTTDTKKRHQKKTSWPLWLLIILLLLFLFILLSFLIDRYIQKKERERRWR